MALELAKYFTNQGHKVAVVTGTPLDGSHDNFPFEVYRILNDKAFRDVFVFRKIINEFNPDIIYANDLLHILPLVWIKAKLGLEVVFRTAGNDIEGAWFNFIRSPVVVRRRVLLQLLKKADGIITNSEYTSGILSKYQIKNNNIFKVVGGVDIEKFRPSENLEELTRETGYCIEDIILLSVARLLKVKGIEITIRAVERLISRYPNIRYLIVGHGPSFDRIRRIIKDLNLKEHVILNGSIPYDYIEKYFKICDIYVLTPILYEDKGRFSKSIHIETMGRGYCQASACGKPCVGSRVGGVPEVVLDGVNGILVQPDDVEGTTTAIEKLICEPEYRQKLGEGGLRLSHELFSWDVVGKRIEKILLSM